MNFEVQAPSNDLIERAMDVRRTATQLGQTTNEQRRFALEQIANALSKREQDILAANEEDLDRSQEEGLSNSLMSRLKLTKSKLQGAIEGVRKVAQLEDPLGLVQLNREIGSGLILERLTVPLGVLGVIFEARPDALIQIASLAIRSGNGAMLKGGREAIRSNEVIMESIQSGLDFSDINRKALTLLTTREESLSLLRLDGLVDLIIPRGSNELVRFIQDNTRIPVLGHADGVCHLYIDLEADIEQALNIAIDSKTQYPAACNAIETLLLHREIASEFLEKAIPAFKKEGVLLLGDSQSQALGIEGEASEDDWDKEYLDLVLSIRIVDNFEMALEHILLHGSRHTESIVTSNKKTAESFLRAVDSAGVYHNCSTRFADGFRYGFGAEVGISTQTLPPRGPVGLEGLVTYRYFLRGDGHIVSDFVSGKISFSHKDF